MYPIVGNQAQGGELPFSVWWVLVITYPDVLATVRGSPLCGTYGQLPNPVWPQCVGALLLAGSHLRAFTSEIPLKGMDPNTLEGLLATAELPSSSFPGLRITSDDSPVELRRFVVQVKNNAPCQLCKGSAQVHRSVIRGYKTQGGLRTPIEGTEMYVCPRCEGSAYNQTDALYRILSQMALAVAQADVRSFAVRLAREADIDGARRVFEEACGSEYTYPGF